jgi:hypothetical protein
MTSVTDSLLNRMAAIQGNIMGARQAVATAHPSWQGKDVRLNVFSKVRNVVGVAQIAFELQLENLTNPEWWVKHYPNGAKQHQQNPQLLQNTLNTFDTFISIGLYHGVFSVVESTTRQIYGGVIPLGRLTEFKNVYAQLLSSNHLVLPKLECLLDFMRLIRNTIHNNGYYMAASKLIMFNGKVYPFLSGTALVFVDVALILDIVEELTQELPTLMTSVQVSSIPDLLDIHES